MKRVFKFEIYRDTKLEWRWRLAASNGNIVADSGEGYKRKSSAVVAIANFRAHTLSAAIVYVRLTDSQKRKIEKDFKIKLRRVCE